jgi:hypothetical protein
MNRFQKNLPDNWREWTKKYALKISDGKFDDIGAGVLRGNVRLSFDDGSFCFFEGAFFVVDEEINEILVVTEHCGYHVFPLSGIYYEYYEWTEPIIKKEDAEQDS